jgi:hypothetical protein
VSARAKKFTIRKLLQISSSRSYESPNKLFVVSGDMGIQQIIHGLGGGRRELGAKSDFKNASFWKVASGNCKLWVC